MGNVYSPPPPQIKDGKMVRFGFCVASSLLWGEWGFAVPFYSVQDCSFHHFMYLETSGTQLSIQDLDKTTLLPRVIVAEWVEHQTGVTEVAGSNPAFSCPFACCQATCILNLVNLNSFATVFPVKLKLSG